MTPDDRKAADLALAVSFGAKTYCEVGKPETLTIGTVSLLQLIAEVREQAKAEALGASARLCYSTVSEELTKEGRAARDRMRTRLYYAILALKDKTA